MADKKERIMDLMRKGVITNEEALELLEKMNAGGSSATEDVEKNSEKEIESEIKSKLDAEGFENHRQDTGDSIKNTLNQAADKLSDLFKGLSKTVDDNVDFSNGWPKVKTIEKTVEFDILEPFDSVSLDVKGGKVTVKPGDNAHIKVLYKIYGAVSDVEQYLAENTKISTEEATLDISAAGRIAAYVELYLPNRIYTDLTFKLLNGKILLDGVETTNLTASSKNGELGISNTKTDKLSLDLINGDIKFDGSFIDGQVLLTNGGIRMTQHDNRAKNLTAKSINGEVKLSVPESLALTGRVKTVFGNYKTRLRLDQPFESGKSGAAVVRSGDDNLTFELETKSGTIWLKDGE
ncbi:MAG: DUF4097 family beta strand repeat-containing protein [Streptococcaceae bacterium]|jgi:DUF4097 and DUF4098 domain-containing protein YvlB|nr:DUF4097 family beta strand repeat-containing protein [Streptococcaceae bacterium]